MYISKPRKTITFKSSYCHKSLIHSVDYYPGGMPQPGRQYNSNSYRYGFNGMEKDDEVKGGGNSLDFGARVYDPRLGKFLSIDPDYKLYTSWSPYLFAGNNPIRYIDLLGRGPDDAVLVFSGAIVSAELQPSSASTVDIADRATEFSGFTQHFRSYYFEDPAIFIVNVADIVEDWVADHGEGTVSLVGYSYGAALAGQVAAELNNRGIDVDLLYTIDGADGGEGVLDHTITPNVALNKNVFQQNNTGAGVQEAFDLHGAENRTDFPNETTIINDDQSDDNFEGEQMDHFNIDDANVDDAIENINETQGNL